MRENFYKPIIIITYTLLAFLTITITTSCNHGIYQMPTSNRWQVKTGLEVFIDRYADDYEGKSAILVTNHSGVTSDLTHNIKLIRDEGIHIRFIISPEHGLYGFMNDFDDKHYNIDKVNNTIVYNIYQIRKSSVAFLLKRADIVIFDIQDMGMRCYTYISNLRTIMDAMKNTDKELIILDRPNPISYLGVDGPYLEKNFRTRFVSSFPAPFIYNLTIGEAARYYKGEYAPRLNLKVVKMINYRRNLMFSQTGLHWVPPSPNLPTYESSIMYTAMVFMEGINISIGRGTTKPFEYFGAPWIEPVSFCKGLNSLGLKQFRFRPTYFRPTFSKYRGRVCGGAQIFYLGGKFSPTEVAYKLMSYIKSRYRQARWSRYRRWYDLDYLAGTDKMRKSINARRSYSSFYRDIKQNVQQYKWKQYKYLLYR